MYLSWSLRGAQCFFSVRWITNQGNVRLQCALLLHSMCTLSVHEWVLKVYTLYVQLSECYVCCLYALKEHIGADGGRVEQSTCRLRVWVMQKKWEHYIVHLNFILWGNASAQLAAIVGHYAKPQCTATTLCFKSEVVTGHSKKYEGHYISDKYSV